MPYLASVRLFATSNEIIGSRVFGRCIVEHHHVAAFSFKKTCFQKDEEKHATRFAARKFHHVRQSLMPIDLITEFERFVGAKFFNWVTRSYNLKFWHIANHKFSHQFPSVLCKSRLGQIPLCATHKNP